MEKRGSEQGPPPPSALPGVQRVLVPAPSGARVAAVTPGSHVRGAAEGPHAHVSFPRALLAPEAAGSLECVISISRQEKGVEGCRNLHINLAEGEKIVYHFLLAEDLTLSCLCVEPWGEGLRAAEPAHPEAPVAGGGPLHTPGQAGPHSPGKPQLPPSAADPHYRFQGLEIPGPFSHRWPPPLPRDPTASAAHTVLGHGEHPRLPPRVRAQPSPKGEGRQRRHRREPSRVRGKMSLQGTAQGRLPGGGPACPGPCRRLFIDRGGCPSQGWCLGQQRPTGQDACWRHLESRVLCSGQIQSLGGLGGVLLRTERGQALDGSTFLRAPI